MKRLITATVALAAVTGGFAQTEGTAAVDSLPNFPDSILLGEVSIVAQKPIVKMEADKVTYDVSQDTEAQSSTVLDLLRKVPTVVVDGQDNITVNGSSSFKVYVDGKPSPMFEQNASAVFKAMPASMVSNIEVITHPGAKHDAEGVGGVLNLIMEKGTASQDVNGYNGNLRASASNRGADVSGFVGGQQGKLSYSANALYSYQNLSDANISVDRYQQDSDLGDSSIKYFQNNDITQPYAQGNLSMGYELGPQTTIGVNLAATSFTQNMHAHPTITYEGQLYGDGFAYSHAMRQEYNEKQINGSVDIQHFFDSDHTRSLTLSYLLNAKPSGTKDSKVYDNAADISYFSLSDNMTDNRLRSTIHTLQADFETPLSQRLSLNAGAKFIARHNSSDSRYYDLGDGKVLNEDYSMRYNNTQRILAGYAELGAKLGKWGAKAGVRYERTWEDIEYKLGDADDFSKSYGNLAPSAALSYAFSPTLNLGLNYNLRLSRPGIGYLNPWVDRSDVNSLAYGNSDLDPATTHTMSLTLSAFTQKFIVRSSLTHAFSNDGMSEYTFIDDDNLLNTTYGNIVKSRSTGLQLFARWMATKSAVFMLNGSAAYNDWHSRQLDCRNSAWEGSLYASWQQDWGKALSSNLGVSSMSRKSSLQGYTDGMSIVMASVTKKLLDDKLSLSLRYTAPLDDKLRIKNLTEGSGYRQYTRVNFPFHTVSLTVSWTFGNSKKQYLQHQSNITNDFNEKGSGAMQVPSGN